MTKKARRVKKKEKGAQTGQRRGKRKLPLLLALLGGVCLIVVAVIVAKTRGPEAPIPPAAEQSTNQKNAAAQKAPDLHKLVGRWTRIDGGYVINITGVDTNGRIDAGYFNPRPIHVSVAEASWTQAGTKVYIELNDIGYPGSNYTLDYDPLKDALIGNYYQAVQKQNFNVMFIRTQ